MRIQITSDNSIEILALKEYVVDERAKEDKEYGWPERAESMPCKGQCAGAKPPGEPRDKKPMSEASCIPSGR
jgi:hypothetical protein